MAKEIEILVPVLDKKNRALSVLHKFNFEGVSRVIDIYFYDPARKNLKPTREGRLKESFRLRRKGDKSLIAYKIDHFKKNDTWIYSDEHEFEVSDFKSAYNILTHLGFKKLVVLDNKKRFYSAQKYEIVFEEVKGLGLFLEVEYKGKITKLNKLIIKQEIRKFLKGLGLRLGEELNAGKPEIAIRMAKKKAVLSFTR